MNKLIFEFRVGPFYSDEFCEIDYEPESNESKDVEWSISNILGVFAGKQKPMKPSWAYR